MDQNGDLCTQNNFAQITRFENHAAYDPFTTTNDILVAKLSVSFPNLEKAKLAKRIKYVRKHTVIRLWP